MPALFRAIRRRSLSQLFTPSPLGPNFDLTPFDRTDQVQEGGVRLYRNHSDIKEVELEGHPCCAKVPRFIADQSNSDSFSAFEEVRKYLSYSLSVEESIFSCFQRVVHEAKIHASLSHPNILPFIGFAQGLGPSLALLSPYIAGGSTLMYLRENPTTNRLPLVSSYPLSHDFNT